MHKVQDTRKILARIMLHLARPCLHVTCKTILAGYFCICKLVWMVKTIFAIVFLTWVTCIRGGHCFNSIYNLYMYMPTWRYTLYSVGTYILPVHYTLTHNVMHIIMLHIFTWYVDTYMYLYMICGIISGSLRPRCWTTRRSSTRYCHW